MLNDLIDEKLDNLRTAIKQNDIILPKNKYWERGTATVAQTAPTSLQAGQDIGDLLEAQHRNATLITPQQLGWLGHLRVGFQQGLADEFDLAQKAADWLTKTVGLPKGEGLGAIRDKIKPEDWELDDKGLGATILRAVGMTPIMLGEAMLAIGSAGAALPVQAVRIGGKQGLKFLGKQAVKKLATQAATKVPGRLFHLAPPVGLGAISGLKTAVQPEATLSDVLKGTAFGAGTGAGLSAVAPFGPLTRTLGTAGTFGMGDVLAGAPKEQIIASLIMGGIFGRPRVGEMMGILRPRPTMPEIPVVPKTPVVPRPGERIRIPTGTETQLGLPLLGREPTLAARERAQKFEGKWRPFNLGTEEQLGLGLRGPITETPLPPEGGAAEAPRVESTKHAPETLFISRADIIDSLAGERDFRHQILEQLPDPIIKGIYNNKKLNAKNLVFDPKTKTITSFVHKTGKTRHPRIGKMTDLQIVDEANITLSASRHYELMTELKSRKQTKADIGEGKKDIAEAILAGEEGLVPGYVPPAEGTPEAVKITQAIQNAYQDITSEYPKPEGKPTAKASIGVEDFLIIARDRYGLDGNSRLELAKILNAEGWIITGKAKTLDEMVGDKLDQQYAATQAEEAELAKIPPERQKAIIEEEWEITQNEQLDNAAKAGIIPSKKAFDALDVDTKGDVLDALDALTDLHNEIATIKSQKGWDKATAKNYVQKVRRLKDSINRFFTQAAPEEELTNEEAQMILFPETKKINKTVEVMDENYIFDPKSKFLKIGTKVSNFRDSGATGKITSVTPEAMVIEGEDTIYTVVKKGMGGKVPGKPPVVPAPIAPTEPSAPITAPWGGKFERKPEKVGIGKKPILSSLDEEAMAVRKIIKNDKFIALYKSYRKEGLSKKEALYKAGQVTGVKSAVEAAITSTIPTEEIAPVKEPTITERIEGGKAITKKEIPKKAKPIDETTLAQEIAYIRKNYSGQEDLIKLYEKHRREGLSLEEAASRAAIESGRKTPEQIEALRGKEEPLTRGTKSVTDEQISDEINYIYEQKFKELREAGVPELDAREEAQARIEEPDVIAYIASRKNGMSREEAAEQAKVRQKKVILRTKEGKEREISNKAAADLAIKTQKKLDETVVLATKKGISSDTASKISETTPIAAPDILGRPSGMEDLPNPNSIVIAAKIPGNFVYDRASNTMKDKDVSMNLNYVQKQVKILTESLDDTTKTILSLSKAEDAETDPIKKLDLSSKLRAKKNLRNTFAQNLSDFNAALEYMNRKIAISPKILKEERVIKTEKGGASIISHQMPRDNGRFYIIQGEDGWMPTVQGRNRYIGLAEAVNEGGEMKIKVLNVEKGIDSRYARGLLDTIQQKYMMDTDPPRKVVKVPGIGEDIWKLKEDKDFSRVLNEAEITEKDAGKLADGQVKKQEGIVKKLFLGPGAMSAQENAGAMLRALSSINADFDPTMLREGGMSKLMTNADLVPLVDLVGDPTTSTVPVIRWAANLASQTDFQTIFYLKKIEQYLDNYIGWIRKDPQANKELAYHLRKFTLSSDPKILEAAKHIRIIEDDVANRFELEKKGLYRKDHFAMIIDRDKAWDYYSKVYRNADAYENLPAKAQVAVPYDIWPRAKFLADKYGKIEFDRIPREDRAWIEDNIFPWGGIYTDWMKAPPFLRRLLPKEKYTRFFEHRKTTPAHEKLLLKESVWDTMMIYCHTAVRGGMWSDYLAKVRPVINELRYSGKTGSVRNYLEAYVRKLAFPETGWLDAKWNALIGAINSKFLHKDLLPYFMPKRASTAWARALYRGALGPDTALRNLSQVIHAWANSGNSPILKGIIDYSKEAILEKAQKWAGLGKGPSQRFKDFKRTYDIIDEFFGVDFERIRRDNPTLYQRIQEAGRIVTDIALSPMHFTENINKGIAYFAGLQEAANLGLDFNTAHIIGTSKASKMQGFNLEMSEAQYFALGKMFESQYGYNRVHTSPFLQGTGAKFFTPFWSFPTKSAQFVHNGLKESWLSDDKARFFRLTALTGFMATAPLIASQIGIDVSALWGKGILPFNILPSWYRLIGNTYTALGYGDGSYLDRKKAERAALDQWALVTVPQWRWGKKLVKGLDDLQRGYETWGPGEHAFNEVTTVDMLMKLFGWPPYRSKEARDFMKNMRDEEMKVYDKHQYINKVLDFMEKDTPKSMAAAAALRQKVLEEQGISITSKDIMAARKLRAIDIYTFKMTRAAKKFRAGEWKERLLEAREKYLPTKYGTKSMWHGHMEEPTTEEE